MAEIKRPRFKAISLLNGTNGISRDTGNCRIFPRRINKTRRRHFQPRALAITDATIKGNTARPAFLRAQGGEGASATAPRAPENIICLTGEGKEMVSDTPPRVDVV